MGSNKDKTKQTIERIATAAQDDFDLGASLAAGPVMTGDVRVFTDKPTGAKLGGAEVYEVRNDIGLVQKQLRTWGVAGKIVELSRTPEDEEANADQIATLKLEVEALAGKLEETCIDLTLRSLPPIAKKDAKRAARDFLGLRGKVQPGDERWEEFNDEYDAQILHRTVIRWVRAQDGEERKGMSVENARSLKNHLDETEYIKITIKLNELLWERQIAEKAVEDADFSHGI